MTPKSCHGEEVPRGSPMPPRHAGQICWKVGLLPGVSKVAERLSIFPCGKDVPGEVLRHGDGAAAVDGYPEKHSDRLQREPCGLGRLIAPLSGEERAG